MSNEYAAKTTYQNVLELITCLHYVWIYQESLYAYGWTSTFYGALVSSQGMEEGKIHICL